MATPGADTMGMADIPTIGIGPGDEALASSFNDYVKQDEIEKCMAIYATIPDFLPEVEL